LSNQTKMDQERKVAVYKKTNGYCHICHRKLSLKNHGKNNEKGGWHLEHSIPKARGGTEHLNNLFAACIPCNLEKGTMHNRTIRARYGTTRAPYSKAKKDKIRNDNTLAGGALGFIGSALFGAKPWAVVACTLIGAQIGKEVSEKI